MAAWFKKDWEVTSDWFRIHSNWGLWLKRIESLSNIEFRLILIGGKVCKEMKGEFRIGKDWKLFGLSHIHWNKLGSRIERWLQMAFGFTRIDNTDWKELKVDGINFGLIQIGGMIWKELKRDIGLVSDSFELG